MFEIHHGKDTDQHIFCLNGELNLSKDLQHLIEYIGKDEFLTEQEKKAFHIVYEYARQREKFVTKVLLEEQIKLYI
jgi:hypothetical protein